MNFARKSKCSLKVQTNHVYIIFIQIIYLTGTVSENSKIDMLIEHGAPSANKLTNAMKQWRKKYYIEFNGNATNSNSLPHMTYVWLQCTGYRDKKKNRHFRGACEAHWKQMVGVYIVLECSIGRRGWCNDICQINSTACACCPCIGARSYLLRASIHPVPSWKFKNMPRKKSCIENRCTTLGRGQDEVKAHEVL